MARMSMSPYSSDKILSGQAIISWESVTEKHIQRHMLRYEWSEDEPEMIDLVVRTNIVNQGFPETNNNGQRLLQQEGGNQTLLIQFDVSLSYRSVGANHDLDKLVFSAWDDSMDRAEYVMELQSQSDVFHDVEDVIVEVEGFVPIPSTKPETESTNIAVIAGASVGGAALLILVVFLLTRSRNGKKNRGENTGQSRTTPDSEQKINVAT